jgi:osmoprotectant transport system substrate-binding protein
MSPRVAATLMGLVVACAVAGCGGSGPKRNGEVTITVTSRNFAEEKVLREIYAGALEAAGFRVKRKNVEPGLPSQALENGVVSGYPDHIDNAITDATPIRLEEVPGDPHRAYEESKARFEEKGLVPFPPASIVRTNAVALLRETAERRGLQKLVDLRGRAADLSVQGEYYCRARADCLAGLERRYGIAFESFVAAESFPRLYRALRRREADAVMLVTTEGRLARKPDWLVLLEDDRHRLPAANVFWLTRQDVIDEAGPDYERAILAAQKGLTLREMRRLNAAVELDGRSPAAVAAEYMKSIGHAR